jgi:hypothetical protein
MQFDEFESPDYLPKDLKYGDALEVKSQSISSWSYSREIASMFGGSPDYRPDPASGQPRMRYTPGITMATTVPRQMVFSTFATGSGCLEESEVVLLGGTGQVRVDSIYYPKVNRGGPGSGHHGHKGVPGQRGGSSPGSGGSTRFIPDGEYGLPSEEHVQRIADADHVLQRLREEVGETLDFNKYAPSHAAGRLKARIVDEVADRLPVGEEEWEVDLSEFHHAVGMMEGVGKPGHSLFSAADSLFSERYPGITAKSVADGFIKTWASTSRDQHPLAVAIQRAVQKEFGITGSVLPGVTEKTSSQANSILVAANGAGGRILRKIARAVYDNTQDHLAKAGLEEITAFRGMKWEGRGGRAGKFPDELRDKTWGDSLEVKAQPLSSWSLSFGEAGRFGGDDWKGVQPGLTMATKVPRQLVFSTFTSGTGCLREAEVILLAGRGEVLIDTIFHPVERGGPGSGNFGHKGVPGQRGGSAPSSSGLTREIVGGGFTPIKQEDWPQGLDDLILLAGDVLGTVRGGDISKASESLASDTKRRIVGEVATRFEELPDGETDFEAWDDLEAFSDRGLGPMESDYPNTWQGKERFYQDLDEHSYMDQARGQLFSHRYRDNRVDSIVDGVVSAWAQTSGDNNIAATAVQMAIQREFGVTNVSLPRSTDYVKKLAGKLLSSHNGVGEKTLRRVVRAVYDNTQEHLASKGIKELTVFRGMSWEEGDFPSSLSGKSKGDSIGMKSQPASSWSLSRREANNFGPNPFSSRLNSGITFGAKVPAKSVFSTFMSGAGCMREAEVIILGGKGESTIFRIMKPAGVTKGGPGSGHHGHKGVPGQRGGSVPSGGGLTREIPDVSYEPVDVMEADLYAGWVFDDLFEDDSKDRNDAIYADKETRAEAKKKIVKDVVDRLLQNPDGSYNEEAWADVRDLNREFGHDFGILAGHLFSYDRYKGVAEALVDGVVSGWAKTSGDNSAVATAFQMAVQKEFATKGTKMLAPHSVMTLAERVLAHNNGAGERALRRVARAIYDNTQEHLAKQGVKGVTVFRGMEFRGEHSVRMWEKSPFPEEMYGKQLNDVVDVKSQPLSAWSLESKTAGFFGGKRPTPTTVGRLGFVLATTVPAKSVFSTFMTGVGCMTEGEIVLLGGRGKASIYDINEYENYYEMPEEW